MNKVRPSVAIRLFTGLRSRFVAHYCHSIAMVYRLSLGDGSAYNGASTPGGSMGEPNPWTGATPLYRGAYRADARALTGGTHGDVVYEKAVPSGCVYELIRPPSWRGSLSWDNKANHRFSFGDG